MKNSAITLESFSILAKNEKAQTIQEIDASMNFTSIDSQIFEFFGKDSYLNNIKILDLSDTMIDDDGIALYFASPNV